MKTGKVLRRVMILVLSLSLVVTQTVWASSDTPVKYTVTTWSELMGALNSSSSGDVIGIKGVINVPCPNNLKLDHSVTFRRMERDARIMFSYPYGYVDGLTEVKNIDFDGNYANVGGDSSFIYAYADLEFNSCSFSKCYFQSGNGGAVSTGARPVKFVCCNFDENSADNGANIYVDGGTVTLEYCSIYNGWAEIAGGGIYNAGTLFLDGVEIKGCTAKRGGGIFNTASAEISNSLVWDNTGSVQGADIANEGSLSNYTTKAQFNQWLEYYHKYYVGWEDDIRDYGGSGEYFRFVTSATDPDEEQTPTTPEPDPEDPPASDPTDPPTDPPAQEPTDPPVDPPAEDPDTPPTNTPTGGDTYNDNHTEDNSTHTTTDDHSTTDNHTEDNHTEDNHSEDNHTEDNHTEDNHTEDNSTHTSTDDHSSNDNHSEDNHTEDNSTHTDSHTEDNSTHTDSHSEDNSTHTDNHSEDHSTHTDNHTEDHSSTSTDSHDSSVSNVDNSVRSGDTVSNNDNSVKDSNNTTNNDYRSYTYTTNNTDNSKSSVDNHSSSRTGTTGGSQPVNVTVNIPEGIISQNGENTSSQPNINIYSENVEVVYTASKDGGYSIDIRDKDNMGVVPLSASSFKPVQEQDKSPTVPIWVSYANMILLLVLVILEITDKIARKRNR